MSPQENNSRLEEILRRLEEEYPDRSSMLVYENPFQLTAAVALSAQTTDAAVNRATVELFRRWPDAGSLSQAEPADVEDVIHSLGFFRQKAKNLIGASRLIMEKFDGEIPRDMDDLTSLPGIGRKSANVIRAHLWNLPGIIVDTHFGRVCRRLGLTELKDPTKLEREISAVLPEKDHIVFSMTVNLHGRKYCKSRKPECSECPLEDICPKYGVA